MGRRLTLWEVGLFWRGEEYITFGPFTKAIAEQMFKYLSEEPPEGVTPFLRQRPKEEDRAR